MKWTPSPKVTIFITAAVFALGSAGTAFLFISYRATRVEAGTVHEVLGLAAGALVCITGSFLLLIGWIRKAVLKPMRLSEEVFSTAFRVSPDAIAITRLKDGRYLQINEGFTALTGYAPEEIVGRTAIELNIWADAADRRRGVQALQAKGLFNGLEATFQCKDGSTVLGLMAARTIEIDGEPCLLSITRDISEAKHAEGLLRESEANLRTLMDFIPAGVWWFGDGGRIEYCNRCFTEQFGYDLTDIPTLEAWYARAYPDVAIREPYRAARKAAIDEALLGGVPVPPRERKITCKDGTERLVIITTRFALGRTVEIFMDITEREHVRSQLQKVEKLEAVGVLAGGIAHDFNNILTAIMGNISFARSYLDEGHRSSAILLKAERATARAAELAHQLLTFAKGGEPIKQSASIVPLLEEAVALVLRGSKVSAVLDLPAGLHTVEVDPGQMSQVANNLLINATQAMPEGGTITIRGGNVTLGPGGRQSLPSGDYLRIAISDTGCGIQAEHLKRIFDPYFTTKSGGSGLGLASVHSIITRHGGGIEVHSVPGEGTTFELLLPASHGEVLPEATGPAAVPLAAPHDHSVLVMDDEEILREMVSAMLGQLGYRVTACTCGEEAVAHYQEAMAAGSPFTLVMLDLTIPGGMGGREAAQRILALDAGARLIVSSGYSNDPVMSDFVRHGFSATLAKPYTLEAMTQTLEGLKPPAGV